MKSSIKLLSILLVTLTLLGCGLKGPLYIPAETSTISMDSYSLNQTV
ncbi:lipoprotein [Gilliamella sp. B2776]|nr:lipoprotein [Gilliamella sp. B2779]MCX8652963.1 lipoprotein [Gilliamella sp. B2737]MCX8655224.1 lipoprotein [Gilliamella sp. B2894]MCX8664707.1 lipoprotein [Gilliamella sp. B2887]MCX8690973.1 lipoprotein [Gilliamella sp. B2776]MCX8694460.1 lipoprotein [Gilliamella sp. B2881]MCX8696054.1 lipoprotein [Gilliamella sp. B2828]MCX8697302.1 lipoprotein [Gilliamella sp. B3000]MCX8700383.1 lipoprotein [Gilliamella sp. B2840]MCX8702131.1 lipoprotein [Gilliamella sp. B2781]WDM18182.1 lipoprotein 